MLEKVKARSIHGARFPVSGRGLPTPAPGVKSMSHQGPPDVLSCRTNTARVLPLYGRETSSPPSA
ncbi:MAG: hypothetical protein DMF80_19410 [Acidobacteria bacterium]|nr:MAG: hypothetical protein DMF80_19410 [Acidobacteriota bacterium]PYQ19293.1 MAG: hypothetical protein DMF81_22385 [Acidobacteriota bacterium]